jgi:transposase
MEAETYATQRLDHLGIVAGICRHIQLIEEIDARVGPSERKVTVGEAVQAMVLNALGFASRALYLTPEFFTTKPVDLLIREGLQAEDLNDDSLGRALDRLYEAGVTEVFAGVASHALQVYGLQHHFVHLDSTSVSLQGKYTPDADDPRAIRITHGFSKDHRPDLKQAVVSLLCTYRSAIPVWLEVLSGNSADKTTFPQTIQAYIAQLQTTERPYFIADSAPYSQEMLKALWAIRWITRVPETLQEARCLLQHMAPAEMSPSAQKGYHYCEVHSQYGGVPQRWLVVFSQQAYAREVGTFQQQLRRQQEHAHKQLWHLSHREFATEEGARVAVAALEKPWRFHRAQVQVEPVAHYGRRGRPRAGDAPRQVRWRVVGDVVEEPVAVATALQSKGKFILATNEANAERLPAETMLAAYKAQGVAVERGFRFLKDPLFFADSLFLKRSERLMALLMVMGLALLVYALAEHTVRTELVRREESLPNQRGQPTQQPTMRRLFQIFEGIDVLWLQQPHGVQRFVLNLQPIHRQILNLLGPEVQKCYLING